MAQRAMALSSAAATLQTSLDHKSRQETNSTHGTSVTTPTVAETQTDDVSCIRNSFAKYNLSSNVADIIMAS